MKRIGLISCTKYKKYHIQNMDDNGEESMLFQLEYNYVKSECDEIYILSARYGLIREGEYLSDYNENLDYKSDLEIKLWSMSIMDKLNEYTDIHNDEFIILADKNYYKDIVKFLNNVVLPIENLDKKDAIEFLKNKTNENVSDTISFSEKLHILFNNMKKYAHDNLDEIPFTNGIYIILDKKENYKGMHRIVRVGTHIDENRLILRIKKHFKNGLKDESILRKNIGRAILDYNNNDYITVWNINFNDRRNEKKYSHLRDYNFEERLEKMITYYMMERFEVVCFEVMDSQERLRLEEGIITTLVEDEDFKSSSNWLGNFSPIEIIRNSAMWIKQGMITKSLSNSEFREIITLCIKCQEEVTN